MTTATLVHTSSRTLDNRVAMARVAAGERMRAMRVAAEARKARERTAALAAAHEWVEDLLAAGAERVGFKHCSDMGKHRFVRPVWEAAEVLANLAGEDVEAWGINAAGEYVGEGW
jgi:hypothetical protein